MNQNKEYATIKVKLLYTPEGNHICRTENELCMFYRTTHWGQRELCAFDETKIERGINSGGVEGLGWCIPTVSCPLNKGEI